MNDGKKLSFKFGCRVDVYSQIHTRLYFTRFTEMESKTFLLVFCLVSAAWFMSDTEALYSQNPPNNGRRSMRPSVCTTLFVCFCLFSFLFLFCCVFLFFVLLFISEI